MTSRWVAFCSLKAALRHVRLHALNKYSGFLQGTCVVNLLAVFAVAWLSAFAAQAGTNLVWQTGPGFRFAPLSISTNGQAGFTLLHPSETGITFSNRLSEVA